MPVADLVAELKRRRVFRVLVSYGVVAFAVLQVVEPIQHALGLTDGVLRLVVVLLGLGFPVALVLAWAFDVNAGAIVRTPPVAGDSPPAKALFLLACAGVLIALPGVAWFFLARPAAPVAVPAAPDAKPAAPNRGEGPSIAVLPLVNMSSDKEQDYFSDGLSEELLNLLAQVPGLRVSARTSAFSFKGRNVKVSEIGRELGVGTVLEGSVRKSGDQLRITLQLINAPDGFHLWSETYDRKLTEIFAVQEEIARAVVAALRLKLLPAEGKATPPDPRAHDQFLLGLHFLGQRTTEGGARAEEALERAVALDPGFARAWGSLSEALLFLANQKMKSEWNPSSRYLARSLEAAEKAIALAPSEAAGWAARAHYRMRYGQDWAGARSDVERALALAPSSPGVLERHGLLLAAFGQVTAAVAAAQKSLAADPLRAGGWITLSDLQLGAGDFAGAEASARRAMLLAPGNPRFPRTLGFALLLQHKLVEARSAFESIADDGASGSRFYRRMGAALLAQEKGDPAEALRITEELTGPFGATGAYQLVQLFAWQGQLSRGCEWLGRAFDQRDGALVQVTYDPLLARIRSEPCYAAVVRKLHLPVK